MKQLILTIFTMLISSISGAEEPIIAVEPLDKDSQEKRIAYISQIEEYLNSFDNFTADFEQYSPGHPFAKGEFKLKKPAKFLWQYKEPEAHKIISTGKDVYFIDDKNGQVTQLPKHPILEELLLKKNIKLKDSDKLQVLNVSESERGIDLFLKMSNDEEEMQLALHFDKEPFELKEILTTNQLGHKIYITFKNVDRKKKLSDKLFKYTPPQYQSEDEVW